MVNRSDNKFVSISCSFVVIVAVIFVPRYLYYRYLFGFFQSNHVQLHVYPANSFNVHSLSDVKRVVFIYRCEFLKNHKAKYRTIKPIPNYFQPRIKICHTFGIQSFSFNFSWKGRNFTLMAGIEITLIY